MGKYTFTSTFFFFKQLDNFRKGILDSPFTYAPNFGSLKRDFEKVIFLYILSVIYFYIF